MRPIWIGYTYWIARAFISIGLVISANVTYGEARSLYVSLQEKSCRSLSESIENNYMSRDLYVTECQTGLTVQSTPLRLIVVSSNARSWIDIAAGNTVWSSEDEIVYEKENQFGYFPNIGNSPVEIRVNHAGKVIGLSFRVTAQDPGLHFAELGTSNVSRLFVFAFRESGVCFLGLACDNTTARTLLDTGAECRRVLNAGQQ